MFDDVSVGKEWQEVEEEDSWKEEGRKEGEGRWSRSKLLLLSRPTQGRQDQS